MIFGLRSIRETIARIIIDLDLGDRDIPWSDMVEWIADALKHIGVYYQFTEKEKAILITNYKGELPCDFYQLKRVLVGTSCRGLTRGGMTPDDYSYILKKCNLTWDDLDIVQKRALQVSHLDRASLASSYSQPHRNENLINSGGITSGGLDYNITHNTITASFESGFFTVQYLAIPCDEDGFPMVPDDVAYYDALFWKVVYHLSLRGFDFQNPQLKDITFTKYNWGRHMRNARGSGNMPDLHQLEKLKNNWLRLYPDGNPEQSGYASIGRPQRLDFNGAN